MVNIWIVYFFILIFAAYKTTMITIIFKYEKNAKVYDIRSAKAQGVYAAGELIRVVKTDKINTLLNDGQYQVTATEIKA